MEACIAAAERAHEALVRLEEANIDAREREWALWGLTDIWGLPLR